MSIPLKCSYTPPTTTPSKKNLTNTRKQQLEARVKSFQQLLASIAKSPTAEEAAKRAEFQKLIAHGSIDLQDMVGAKSNKWTGFIGEYLGQYIGKDGKLLKSFFENKRNAANLLKYIAHNNSFETTKPMVSLFKKLAKERGVDKSLHNQLLADLYEVGSTGFDFKTSDATDAVKQLLQQRNDNFLEAMKRAGFSEVDTDLLSVSAADAAKGFENLRLYLSELGFNIDKLDNIGYFPRILTKDAEDYLKVKKLFNKQPPEQGIGVKADFAKNRSSYWFTVEDRDTVANILGLSKDEMDGMLLDTSVLKTTIENTVSDETLEMLIDSGLMSKIPMSSTELHEWLSTRYELPFGNAFNDYFVTDPKRVMEGYVNELESVAASHGIAKALKDQGQLKGVISDVARDSDDINIASLKGGEFLTAAGVDGYINKNVATLLDTALGIERSASKLSQVAQAWQTFTSAMKSQMLTNPQYVARIFIGNTIQYASRGGDLPSLMSGIGDVTKYMLKGINSFDDTKSYRFLDGENLTHRQFMQKLIAARGTTSAPTVDGIKRGSGGADALNPLLFPKKVGMMAAIIKDMNVGEGFGYVFGEALNQYKKASSTLFAPFAQAAGYADFVFKIALAKAVSSTGNTAWDTVRQGVRLGTVGDVTMHSTFKDVLDHVDRAYLTFDDLGKFPAAVSQVIPFFSFTFQNMSGVMRDMLRNPVKYASFARVGSLVYDDVREAKAQSAAEALGNEASLPFFMREDFPFKVFEDENGNFGVLSITNLSPLLSAAADAKTYARFFGIRNATKQSIEDVRKQEIDKTVGAEREDWQNNLAELMNKTSYGTFFNSVTGTGGKALEQGQNSFLGVNVSRGVEGVARVAAPLTGYINSQNPGEIFGTREVLLGDDLDGAKKAMEPKNSVFGAARSDFDNLAVLRRRNPLLAAMAHLGINVRYAEGKANVRSYYNNLDRDLRRLKKGWEELTKQQVVDPKPETQAKLNEVVLLYNKYDNQRYALQQYMMDNKINTLQLEKELKTRRVTLEALVKRYPLAQDGGRIDK